MNGRRAACLRQTLLVGALACGFSSAGARLPARAPRIPPQTFQLLGITLGESTVADVERAFGKAPVAQAINVEEAVQCYTSERRDAVVLKFSSWLGDVVEFQLSAPGSLKTDRCAATSSVSMSLSTANGLRLGLSPLAVIALLGPPSHRENGRFDYVSSYRRQPSPEEIERFNKANYTPPQFLNVNETVSVRFRGGGVAEIDAERTTDW